MLFEQYELVSELFVDKVEGVKEVKAGVGRQGVRMVKQTSLGGANKGKRSKEMRKTVGNQVMTLSCKVVMTRFAIFRRLDSSLYYPIQNVTQLNPSATFRDSFRL